MSIRNAALSGIFGLAAGAIITGATLGYAAPFLIVPGLLGIVGSAMAPRLMPFFIGLTAGAAAIGWAMPAIMYASATETPALIEFADIQKDHPIPASANTVVDALFAMNIDTNASPVPNCHGTFMPRVMT